MWMHHEIWQWAVVLAALSGLVWLSLHRSSNRSRDLSWRPWHLRHAQLAYAEAEFHSSGPLSITARIDRAYRVDGQLFLVELKTRSRHCVYRYDVIELSAQRVAIQADTGEAVASIAYVLTQLPGNQEVQRHRVKLMSAADIAELSDRRLAILSGQVQACRTRTPALCRKCAYAKPCAQLHRSD